MRIAAAPFPILMPTFFLLVYTFSLQAENTLLGPQPDWDNQLNFADVERRLQTEAIVKIKDISSFLKESNKIFKSTNDAPPDLVVLESGLKAVFKEGEDDCYAEVGSYKASKALGLRLVPPTVLRKIKGKIGSLQFYVASKIDLLVMGRAIYEKLRPKDFSDMGLFGYIFNRWDANRANQIVCEHQGTYYIALIDNAENIFLTHPKLRLKSVAASTLMALEKINNRKTLEEIWSDYLAVNNAHARKVIEGTLKRIQQLLKKVEKKKIIIIHNL